MRTTFCLKIMLLLLITQVPGLAKTKAFVFEGTIGGLDKDISGLFPFDYGDSIAIAFEIDYSVEDQTPRDINHGHYPNAVVSLAFHHEESGFTTRHSGGEVQTYYELETDGYDNAMYDGVWMSADRAETNSYIFGELVIETAFYLSTMGTTPMLDDDSLPNNFMDINAQYYAFYLYTGSGHLLIQSTDLTPYARTK